MNCCYYKLCILLSLPYGIISWNCMEASLLPFFNLSTGRPYACYGTIHLHRNMFSSTLPPFCPEQYMHIATTCSAVPCFRCPRSYSIICIPDWQSPHVPNCSVLMVSYEIADGQPSLSQDTSCLLPWLGQRDFLAIGGGFPEGVHQPYHHVFWAICEYFLTDSCPFLLLPWCRIIMMLSCHEMLSSS